MHGSSFRTLISSWRRPSSSRAGMLRSRNRSASRSRASRHVVVHASTDREELAIDLGVGLGTGQQLARSRRGTSGLKPGLSTVELLQPASELDLAVFEQRMQVLPDDLRNQRIVDRCRCCTSSRTASGSTPSIFLAAMATCSRTSGLGSRASSTT